MEKVYGSGPAAVRALKGVSLGFAVGELVAITGPSGSAKSPSPHALGASEGPSAGRVVLDARDLSGLSDGELTRLRREHMGFVFRFFNLMPALTAEAAMLPVLISDKKGARY